MRRIVPILLCAFVLVMAENAWVGPAMPDQPVNNPNVPKLAKPRAQETPKILTRKSDAQSPVTANGFSTAPTKAAPLSSRERTLEPTDAPDETLHYDTRLASALGLTAGGTFWSGARFTPTVGCTLKAILFYQWDATTANGYVYVFDQGTSGAPGAVLDSLSYTGAGGSQWKRISLPTPRVMASGRDFWIGVKTTHTAGQYPLGFDYYPPGVSQRSFFFTQDRVNWSDYASTYGSWNLQAVVAFLPYPDDMAAMSIDGLTSPKAPNQWLTIKATVKNVGTNTRASGVPVVLRIAGPSYSYSDTVTTVTSLAPNATEQVVYSPNWRVPATLGIYTLTVFTDLSGDANRGNDTTRYTLEVTNWLTYADWNNSYWYTWAGPEKGVMFDPTEFGVAYPVQIESLKTSFYLGSKRWRDSTYRYKIYGGDLQTVLYTSAWLEAGTGTGIYKHRLPTPVTITSGSYLVAVECANDSGPYVFGDNVHRWRSVYGNATAWYYWTSGELFISSFASWTASANDVGMTGIRAPWLYTEPNVPMSPVGQLMNFGTASQATIPCSVFVYDTTTFARVYTGYGTTSANAGDTARVTFSPQWTPPSQNDVYYTYMATFLPGDANRGNDSAYHEFFGFGLNDPLVAPKALNAVTVDGNIQATEWEDANRYDVSNILGWSDPLYRYFPNNCFGYFKHDSLRLYVAIDIPFITTNDSTEVGLYFDENNDGAWAADSSEGNYWAEHFPPTDSVIYRALTPSAAWQTTATGSVTKASLASGHLQFEMMIPFGTGKPALNVNPDNDTIGFWTYVLDGKYYEWVGWWKTTMDAANWRDPSFYGHLILTGRGGDVAATGIVSPVGAVNRNDSVTPSAKWRNNNATQPAAFTAYFSMANPAGTPVYSQSLSIPGLAAGRETTLVFPKHSVGTDTGNWSIRCSTAYQGDTIAANNVATGTFRVNPPWPQGWMEVGQVPMTPSGKAVKDGASMAYNSGSDLIYLAKGNKTADFYSYNAGGNAWLQLAPVPPGREGKPVSKGASACASGNTSVFLTKGNNTVGFYEYDIPGNVWYQRTDVPLGVSGKKVKGGTGLAWGSRAGVGAVYVLKGYKNEFYKYNPTDSTWTTLTPAPVGANQKWDKGSWLVGDGSHTLYAHKAKYHEFYAYDTEMDSWSAAKTAMPIPGSAGSKKSKDGGAAAYMGSQIYAFKGGNTVEFWRYTPLGDSWREQEQIPLVGSTGKKKKIKAGGALAGYQEGAIFATKGNKCLEFWRYVPRSAMFAGAEREGVMAGKMAIAQGTSISPNPLAGGFAVLRYGLPKAGAAQLSVYNVAGQTVMARTLAAGRSGIVNLDLRHLSNGVYLVKFSSEGFASSQKLVVQR
jgi:hypothetical protein